MEPVLIAFDNDPSVELHSFFESCADDAKQFCVDNEHTYTSVCPPNFTTENVVSPMDKYSICFVAAHGDPEGIYNGDNAEVLSVRTTNYNLNGKILYAVSCSCASGLLPELKKIGLSTFVGYNDKLRVDESDTSFQESAMEGLKSLLAGDDKETAKQKMLKKYIENIKKATSLQTKLLLTHNREHLCFE